jgi:hypothetical protein
MSPEVSSKLVLLLAIIADIVLIINAIHHW